jgi:hypothetical protein
VDGDRSVRVSLFQTQYRHTGRWALHRRRSTGNYNFFVDPLDPFLARTPGPAPPTAPGRVGITRPDNLPSDAWAPLTFQTVEFDDVVCDLGPEPAPMELAVRNMSPPVEILMFEVGREEARDGGTGGDTLGARRCSHALADRRRVRLDRSG